jgi:1-deoxy-D-xylulose-5-phosphate synthase
MAQSDDGELRVMLLTAMDPPCPASIRFPRGNGFGVDISQPPQKLEIGKAEVIKQGDDVAILALGDMVYPAVEAAEQLGKDGIHATVVNARFVKPLDEKLITEISGSHRLIITSEDAYLAGGFGSAVMELLEQKGLSQEVRVVRLGVSDEIVPHGDPKVLLAQYGLTADGIADKVRETLSSMESPRLDSQRIRAVK